MLTPELGEPGLCDLSFETWIRVPWVDVLKHDLRLSPAFWDLNFGPGRCSDLKLAPEFEDLSGLHRNT
jgi:hypothetical protein